jgi:hypothetical protein
LAEGPDARGLSCDATGLHLAGAPLLQTTPVGFEPRADHEIQALIAIAYLGAEDGARSQTLGENIMIIDYTDEKDLANYESITGKFIGKEKFALALASTIIREKFGNPRLKFQLPLRAKDLGDTWIIEGSHQHPGHPKGDGNFYLELSKTDARVLKMGHRSTVNTSETPEFFVNLLKELNSRIDQE